MLIGLTGPRSKLSSDNSALLPRCERNKGGKETDKQGVIHIDSESQRGDFPFLARLKKNRSLYFQRASLLLFLIFFD